MASSGVRIDDLCEKVFVMEWKFKTGKGEPIHPETVMFPLTSPCAPNTPYEVIGTGFFIQKPGIFLTARHCLYQDNHNGQPWEDLTAMAHHALGIEWLIDFADRDLAIGQLKMNSCEQCANHKVFELCTWKPEPNEVMVHWGCAQSEIELLETDGTTDVLSGQKVFTGYRGKFENYHENGISLAKWPCYQTNAEFPSAASGRPVTNGIGRACAINSTSSEGGGYSTAVLIKNVLDSKVPGNYLVNDQSRDGDLTFGEVLKEFGAVVLEGAEDH